MIDPGLLGGESTFGLIGLLLVRFILVTAGSLPKIFTRPDLADGPR